MSYVDNKQQWSWTLKDTKDKDLYISNIFYDIYYNVYVALL